MIEQNKFNLRNIIFDSFLRKTIKFFEAFCNIVDLGSIWHIYKDAPAGPVSCTIEFTVGIPSSLVVE